MKIVYLAHPISGDVTNNIIKILSLCKRYHTTKVFPFVPYIVPLQYLDDNIKGEREKGIKSNLEILKRGIVDELWVCGNKISMGMKKEIELAKELKIPIIYKLNG